MIGLREKLGQHVATAPDRKQAWYERFGVIDNPFPPASQPMGHPHLRVPADDAIERKLAEFLDDPVTQVVVIEGTQGLGKTNLLEYYQRELADLLAEADGYYIVRYLPDPEPSFSRVVRRLFQEFGEEGLVRLGKRMASSDGGTVEQALSSVRSYEVRQGFERLAAATGGDEGSLHEVAQTLLEFLTGNRVLKHHRETLGVSFRLDTTESMTQALHDLVTLSSALGQIRGIFLFVDELEKQGALTPRAMTTYLSSIRALIDALPRHFFLVLAMTGDALRRYREALPALAGRLGDVLPLESVDSSEKALALYDFYLEHKRTEDREFGGTRSLEQGDEDVIPRDEVRRVYFDLEKRVARQGSGVAPRALLGELRDLASARLATAETAG